MEKKTLAEIFSKYKPLNHGESEIFEKAYDISVRQDKKNLMYEVHFSYPTLLKKSRIYSLEANIREFYELSMVKFMPSYSAELFSNEYISEVVEEARQFGVAARAFFNEYNLDVDGDNITVSIPFEPTASIIIELAETEKLMEKIIFSEFGIHKQVKIVCTGVEQSLESYLEKREAEDRIAFDAQVRRLKEKAVADKEKEELESGPKTEKVKSLFDGDGASHVIGDGIFECGKMKFDISGAEVLMGNSFEIKNPTPLRSISYPSGGIIVLGEVFKFEERELRGGEKFSVSVGITDKDSSAYIKKLVPAQELDTWKGVFKCGTSVAVKGRVILEKFDGELAVDPKDVLKIKRILREDRSAEKRIELHLHTNMSEADALIKPDEAVKTAYRWGHPGVAITDHGNLQSFPIAMLTAEKLENFKVVYGMEAYYVDDTARAVYGDCSDSFDGEFIVFDIETTGLSAQNDRITEIGAVKVKNGEVLETYNSLVNPKMHIPEKITELTGISDETVKDAPTIDVVLPEFFEFIGSRLLIAHNANFDTSFIRRSAERLKLTFENPYLDTVAMSHYVNPELSKHKLDTLANYFGLGEFNHHRASDDAEMLSLIFFKMIEKLRDEGIDNFARMTEVMSEKSDPLKLKTYHQIILVKNKAGLRNLYILVSDSYLKYFRRFPRIPKTHLEEYREGLLIGSACEAGELYQAILSAKPDSEIERIADFYDYLEIQPISNNSFMIVEGTVKSEEELRNINRRIYELG